MALPGTALVMIAAFQWGLAGGLGSLLMSWGWAAETIALWRSVVGLSCMLAWLTVAHLGGRHFRITQRLLCWSLVAGLGVAGNFLFYFISISEGGVAVAATLMYSAPIFVYLIAFITRAERPTAGKLFTIALVMAGIVMLTGVYRADAEAVTLWGITSGLLAGVCYALFIFGFKYAGNHGGAPAILTVALTVSSLLLVPLVSYSEALSVPFSSHVGWFITLGLIGAGLSFYCYVTGLRNALPTVASIVAMIEPVTAAIFGLMVLGESLTLVQAAGMLLILIAITALSASQTMARPTPPDTGPPS